eukprot:1348611-Amorphochlora_amoeboformis.AAC.1
MCTGSVELSVTVISAFIMFTTSDSVPYRQATQKIKQRDGGRIGKRKNKASEREREQGRDGEQLGCTRNYFERKRAREKKRTESRQENKGKVKQTEQTGAKERVRG